MSALLDTSAAKVVPSFGFLRRVEEISGQPVSRCYQCKKCSGGCPMTFAMDILPNQVVRYVALGLEEPLLRSRTIWVCAGCKTCASRCPNGIDIAAVNDALKELAARAGKASVAPVLTFHQAFLSSVEKNGRLHELGMMIGYKMRTGTYTSDLPLGLQMFTRGTLKLFAEKVRQKREIQQIFRLAKEGSR